VTLPFRMSACSRVIRKTMTHLSITTLRMMFTTTGISAMLYVSLVSPNLATSIHSYGDGLQGFSLLISKFDECFVLDPWCVLLSGETFINLFFMV
jgi:hypothetical protein